MNSTFCLARCLYVLLLGAALSTSVTAPAQMPDAPPGEPETPAGGDAADTTAQATPASEDVFVPSVEVSEDTSVPFPVDI